MWLIGWACPDSHDLKLSNRPVRTRMPGGVAGVQLMTAASYADRMALCEWSSAAAAATQHSPYAVRSAGAVLA